MHKIILVAVAALSLTACSPLDAIEGKKSPEQVAHENGTLAPNLWTEPTPEPEPVNIADGIAPCVEQFRAQSCRDGQPVEWIW